MGLGLGFILSNYLSSHKELDIKKPLYYRSPMNPSVTSPVPAKDPMGMDYIPVYAEEKKSVRDIPGTVRVSPAVVQNIGIRLAKAEKKVLGQEIQTVGRVDYNEELLSRLHPKTEGWIEELYIDKVGDFVKKDVPLLSFYSPKLVASQQEELLALQALKAVEDSPFAEIREGAKETALATKERLRLLDVPEHQIKELEKTGEIKKALHIHSPYKGIVVTVGARKGQYVTPKTELYTIADLSKVWVIADVYEYELDWVQIGDESQISLSYLPGKKFKGKVAYVYPFLEGKSRTGKVRLEFDNPNLLLKPEMIANVLIKTRKQLDAIVIPEEAVIRSGQAEHVFVAKEPGVFEPRDVKLGVDYKGLVQVLEGITEGEKVVHSGQFLIDSESKLKEASMKMSLGNSKTDSQLGDTKAQKND